MKPDLFTKIILTVIAVCLVVLAWKSLVPEPAVARQEEVIKVDLVRIGGYFVSKFEVMNIGQPTK